MAGCEYGWEKTCVVEGRLKMKLDRNAVDHEMRQ